MDSITNENKHLLINGENLIGLNLINGLRYFDFVLIDPFYDIETKNNEGIEYFGNLHNELLHKIEQRLYIVKEMMNDTGVIAVHIREEEYDSFKSTMDKVFGKDNFRNTFLLRKARRNINNNNKFYKGLEFLLLYSKSDKFDYRKSYIDNISKSKEECWIEEVNFTEEHIKWCKEREFRDLSNSIPSSESIENANMVDWLIDEIHGKNLYELKEVKSLKTIMNIIDMFTDVNSKICDFYADSGITGQAILELNAKDKGNRIFTLITNKEKNTYSDICCQKIREACNNYNQEISYLSLK